MLIRTFAHILRIRIYMCTDILRTCGYAHTHTHTHIRIYAYTHIRAYVHVNMHIHKCICTSTNGTRICTDVTLTRKPISTVPQNAHIR